jgi:predicted O-linked N-acetylglucosamine transferase (SPINDLY family)
MPGAAAKPDALQAARAHLRAGQPNLAEAIYQRLLATDPGDAAVLLAWGRLRRQLGDAPAASRLLQGAIAAGAGAAAEVALAALLTDHGQAPAAEALLRRVLARTPRMAAAQFELGRIEAARGRTGLAADLYRAAIRADPDLAEARLALAQLLAALGEAEPAVLAYDALLRRDPAQVEALLGKGWALGQLRRFHDALACFDRAGQLGADLARPLAEVALGLAHVCDWSQRETLRRRLRARLQSPEPCLLDPYAVLCQEDDPALQQQMAVLLAGTVRRHLHATPRPARPARREGRIRLGYLSCDFNQHATALLMAGVFAGHDRACFETIAFCYSTDDGSPMRRRVVAAFDRFEELGLDPPGEAASRIAAAGVDILIDLKGYTTGTRPEIPALRPAPLQVSHLGYPATMGAGWYDYVIADPVVLPMSEQPFWHERIVHLPHCYQPNDRTRPLPPPEARAAHGLPAEGVVFACFSNTYKITPELFAVWMELLAELPAAVLWLYAANPVAAGALRAAAGRAGVAPERLYFAEPADLERHLARHACADLMLDTSPYGAHTTAADALWTGLPVITWTGACFAARVAASLLHAVGLPELVAASREDYKALALRLARDPARLRQLRARLEQARGTAPLFDAARFTRNLERAYLTMMERQRAGLPPEAFAVADDQPCHQPSSLAETEGASGGGLRSRLV